MTDVCQAFVGLFREKSDNSRGSGNIGESGRFRDVKTLGIGLDLIFEVQHGLRT